jgi:hypothetical protein
MKTVFDLRRALRLTGAALAWFAATGTLFPSVASAQTYGWQSPAAQGNLNVMPAGTLPNGAQVITVTLTLGGGTVASGAGVSAGGWLAFTLQENQNPSAPTYVAEIQAPGTGTTNGFYHPVGAFSPLRPFSLLPSVLFNHR